MVFDSCQAGFASCGLNLHWCTDPLGVLQGSMLVMFPLTVLWVFMPIICRRLWNVWRKFLQQILAALKDALLPKIFYFLATYLGCVPWASKKAKLLATDIFVLGQCFVSKSEDRWLKTLFHPMEPTEVDPLTSCPRNSSDIIRANPALIMLCAPLKEHVDSLCAEMLEMQEKINSLEETTLLKVQVHTLSLHHDDHNVTSVADASQEGENSVPKTPAIVNNRLTCIHSQPSATTSSAEFLNLSHI